jgi:hypothetical protein
MADNGDAINGPASSAVLAQTVNGLPNPVMTLSSNLNPSSYGQSVTFLAVLWASDATGVVTLLDGGISLGAGTLGPPVPISGGSAAPTMAFTTSVLSVGAHSITAQYLGDSRHGATAATVAQTVR